MERNLGITQIEPGSIPWKEDHPGVSAYLDRCQVDTPDEWIRRVWDLVSLKRSVIDSVIEFGAGDGRFSCHGKFNSYLGYEVDDARRGERKLPPNAQLIHACAFSSEINDADLCIGNPPYVRNQDLPLGWRESVAHTLMRRLDVRISGLANAWQYFFLLSLASTSESGLVALIIPYEWVSRPSSKHLRDFIRSKGWSVEVYRLPDSVFGRKLTTASITLVDKSGGGRWSYFDTDETTLEFRAAKTATLGTHKVIEYVRQKGQPAVAKRGLSPGTQKVFVLTEGERVRYGLQRGRDVVPAVTTMRILSPDHQSLTQSAFERNYVLKGMRCWLLRSDRRPSKDLQLYLDSIPKHERDTSTCNNREIWWKFRMPEVPNLLISMGFRGQSPKVLVNEVGACAVGGVAGIYCNTKKTATLVSKGLRSSRLAGRLVSYSTGLLKLEVNQLNNLLGEILNEGA